MIEPTTAQQMHYIATAKTLHGNERRIFMSRVVQGLGRGGQRYAERSFNWNRRTIRKGMAELTSGVGQTDHFSARGRKLVEERLPNLLADLRAIVDGQSQEPMTSCTRRVVTGLRMAEVRRQLIETKGYAAEVLPGDTTLRRKLTQLGYHLCPTHRINP
jgi:hypothetical protein